MNNKIVLVIFGMLLISANIMVGTASANSDRHVVCGVDPCLYVTNSDNNTVSVISLATNDVIRTIKVGDYPYGITVNPKGNRVYVTNSNSVSVIDTAKNAVISTIKVEGSPNGIAINPKGTRAYVTSLRNLDIGDIVSVIDTSNNRVIDTIVVGILGCRGIHCPRPNSVAVTSKYVYVNNGGGVWIIDATTDKIVSSTAGIAYSIGIAANPKGTKVYVGGGMFCSSNVIDTKTNTVVSHIKVCGSSVTVNPEDTRVYIGNSVIDTSSNLVIDTINDVGRTDNINIVGGSVVSSDGTRVYFSEPNIGTIISVVDAKSDKVIDTIKVGTNFNEMALADKNEDKKSDR